ncbi:DUF6397 family protein [Streptomyces sp. NPDC005181]|uniref:DUF6397 family protein n=1 Tax=Streptomyces sp. NPDC005181 TaxID=3156869 RepID=UPI0033B77796
MAVTEAARTEALCADATTAAGTTGTTVAAGRAAQELGLRRGEFELAVHLGIVRTTAEQVGGRPRTDREEIDRIRSEDGFPDALRDRVRTVGTAEGARLLGISPVRFTRLARAGCMTPITFYLNRYRAVVWLYLAQEVLEFAARAPQLLAGNSPVWMRARLDAGTDWRARNWRAQRIERLLSRTKDPWRCAAVLAGALDPVQLAEVVDDPYERAYLAKVRPEPVFGPPGSVAAREAMAQLMQADDPDEILWRRINLIMELDSARDARQAPRPGDDRRPVPVPVPVPDPVPASVPVPVPAPDPLLDSAGGLLARLRLRRRATARRTVGNGSRAKSVDRTGRRTHAARTTNKD